MQVSIGEIRGTRASLEPGSVNFYELGSIGTACEFGLSLIS